MNLKTLSAAGLALALAFTPTGVLGGTTPTMSATVQQTHVNVVTLGDSITHGGGNGYQVRFGEMLTAAGLTHTITNLGVGGSPCSYWPSRVNDVVDTYNPDVILLSCGTNDDTSTPTTITALENAYRSVLTTAGNRGIPVIASWVQYSDPRTAPQASWLRPSEKRANDAIYRVVFGHGGPAFPGVPVADFQQIPGTPDYLDPLGIHPIPPGYARMGHIFYKTAAVKMGWPSPATLGIADPCGLSGVWDAYPARLPGQYVPCYNP